MKGKLYINYGRPIVDCPYGCNNSYRVKPRQDKMFCNSEDGCHVRFDIEIPSDVEEIAAELNRRPDKANRNWFPDDHPLAVRRRLPQGQTVADLRAEFEMNHGRR